MNVVDLAEERMRRARRKTLAAGTLPPPAPVIAAMTQRSSYEASLDLFNGVNLADRLLQEARNFGGLTGAAASRPGQQDEHAGPHRGSFQAAMDLWHGRSPPDVE